MTTKLKILFVDDERQILVSLRALFRSEYQVYLAETPARALDIVRQENILAIISDQRMPQMLGHELLRQVKIASPNTTRLLLTGYSDLSAIMNSINDGEIFRFIHKPWNNAELRATVRSAVNIAHEAASSIYTQEGYFSSSDISDISDIELEPLTLPGIKAAAPSSIPTPVAEPQPVAERRQNDWPHTDRRRQPAAAADRRQPSVVPAAVKLPATPAPLTGTAQPAATQAPDASAERLAGPAVLVLDDALDTYTRLRALLLQRHPVRLAHTIDKAIDVLDQEEVALLVTDVTINGEDATDFIKLLKQQYPTILTLVITDAADADLAIELINQGRIFRYLRKPAGDGTLKLSVNQGLRFYAASKAQPELARQQQVEPAAEPHNRPLAERLAGRLRALTRRFGFGITNLNGS